MLPDFLRVKIPFQRSLNSRLQELVDADPRITGFSKTYFFEGDRWSQGSESGSRFREFRVPAFLSEKEIIERGPVVFEEHMHEWAEQHVRLMLQRMQGVFEAAADEGSPYVGRLTPDFSFAEYLEFLEKIYFDFDAEGSPRLPSPAVANLEVERRIAGWLNDPLLRPQYDRVIEAKREEWHAREGNRNLVD